MIEEIQEKFQKVEHKSKFIKKLSEKVPTRAITIKQSWLCDSGFWSVPKKYQKIVVKELNATLKKQNNGT